MKYLETKHERNSARITTLITVILILLMFVVGQTYMDPPIEYGVAVNFGTTDVGFKNNQSLDPVKSEDVPVNTPTKTDISESKTAIPNNAPKAEHVLTEDNSETITIKKQEAVKAKQKAEAEAKEKAEADRLAKEKQEQEEKKQKLDALISGISKSDGKTSNNEGNDNQPGNKGQLNGSPYAASYFGDAGTGVGGVGYGLNGRGKATFVKIKQDCNEAGMVVVQIEVDRQGNVVKADPGVKGTENSTPCLLEPAKKIALSHKWKPDPNAPARQIGFVSINFSLGQ